MIEIFLWIFVFVVALGVLLKTSFVFTDAINQLSKTLKISAFFIGISLAAIATSLPELLASLLAASQGYTSMVPANVLGSNIANILLILGLAAASLKAITTTNGEMKRDLALLLGSSALLIMTVSDGTFTALEGVLMIAVYVIYLSTQHEREGWITRLKEIFTQREEMPGLLLMILGSALLMLLSAHFTVKAIINLSELLNVLPSLLSVTLLAVGTSLPELSVTFAALKRGSTELALGNIIGSNIFNATLIMAIPAFIAPLNVTQDVLTVAVPFLIVATLIFAFSALSEKILRTEGMLYVLLYVVFLIQLFTFL